MGITYEKNPIKYVSIIKKESLIPTKKKQIQTIHYLARGKTEQNIRMSIRWYIKCNDTHYYLIKDFFN